MKPNSLIQFLNINYINLYQKNQIIDSLLDYGDNLENCSYVLNEEQKTKLEKNIQTKLLFDYGNPNVKKIDDLNKKYLLNLCKEFGVPDHLKSKDFYENFVTPDSEKVENIEIQIAEILFRFQPSKFQLSPYRILKELQSNKNDGFTGSVNRHENIRSTISLYEYEGGRLKPENIYKFQENIEKYLELFIRFPEVGEQIIKLSKDWVLPKEEHLRRKELASKFWEFSKSPSRVIITGLLSELSRSQQQISFLNQETLEEKQERQAKEALEKSAKIFGQKKVTDFFKPKSETDTELGKRKRSNESEIEPSEKGEPSKDVRPSSLVTKMSLDCNVK